MCSSISRSIACCGMARMRMLPSPLARFLGIWHILKYIFKTYIADGVERHVYREVYSDTSAISSQSVFFLDNLVSLVDMDVGAIEGTIQQLNDMLWQLMLTQDKQYEERASALLDVGNSTEAVPRRIAVYYRTVWDKAFRFHPQPVGFELVNDEVFTESPAPNTVYDLIDYYLRACVKREIRMRVYKNCGRYFAVTGRANTEYCSRPFDSR